MCIDFILNTIKSKVQIFQSLELFKKEKDLFFGNFWIEMIRFHSFTNYS